MFLTPVMLKNQHVLLDYHVLGVAIVDLSHRLPLFKEILDEAESIFRELTGLPDN